MQVQKFRHIGKIVMKIMIGIVALFMLIIVCLQVLEPFIGKKAIATLQHRLQVKSAVGDFHLSIFNDFPSLSLILDDLHIDGTDSTDFIIAHEAALKINLWDLIDGEYIFQSLSLKNTTINIKVDKEENGNWNIFKKSDDSTDLSMKWNEVNFTNVNIRYADFSQDFTSSFHINSGTLTGKLNGSRILLSPDLYIEIHSMKTGGEIIFHNLPIHLKDGDILIDTETSFYKFDKLQAFTAGSEITTNGTINFKRDGSYYDLKFNADNARLQELKNALPTFIKEHFNSYILTGQSDIELTFSGVLNNKYQPALDIDFNSTYAQIKYKDFQEGVTIDKISGSYAINRYGRSNLSIANLEGKYKNQAFGGTCKLANLSNPVIDATFNGVLPLFFFKNLLPNARVMDGIVHIKDFSVQGLKSGSESFTYETLTGYFTMKDVQLIYGNKYKLAIPISTGELKQNDIFILDKSRILYGESDIELQGSITNFIHTLVFPDNNTIAFDVSLKSEFLNLEELFKLYKSTTGPAMNKVSFTDEKDGNHSIFAEAIGKFSADIASWSYNKIKGKSFTGEIFFYQNNYKIQGEMTTCSGNIDMSGVLDRNKKMVFTGKFDCVGINIHNLFSQWNNFNQSFISAENIYGELSGKTILNLQWEEDGGLLYDEIELISSLSVEEGALKNFELLESFSTYVELTALRNIQFRKLRNILIIKDGNVYIPAMFIQSNAMNLTVNGIHTFDQRIDYNIKVNGGQVIMNKFKDSYGIIPARRHGWFNLYYTVTGRIPYDYTYRRDKEKVLSSFRQSVNMRKRYRDLLKESFPNLKPFSEPNEWKNAVSGSDVEDG